jgi:aryl-alcohol dehydrogenase-like predicted oxidoreductase
LGTVKLGRATGVKYPQPFELPSDSELHEFLDAAWEMGVRLYDTAPAYGSSEERLAPFVARHRKEMVLCTKCGEEFDETGSRFDYSAKFLRASLQASLCRLQTDCVDILLLHSNGEDTKILQQTDAVETLRNLKREGKTRAIGISAKTEKGVRAAADTLDVVMAPYSLQAPELAEALEYAHSRGAGVLGIKGLSSGHLALSGEQGAQEALRHVLSQRFLDALILGTINRNHLAQAVRVAQTMDESGG